MYVTLAFPPLWLAGDEGPVEVAAGELLAGSLPLTAQPHGAWIGGGWLALSDLSNTLMEEW